MRYNQFLKQAYHFTDLSHPDNLVANTAFGAGMGAVATSAAVFCLAKLLHASNRTAGIAAAVAAAPGAGIGAQIGHSHTDKWTKPIDFPTLIARAMTMNSNGKGKLPKNMQDIAIKDINNTLSESGYNLDVGKTDDYLMRARMSTLPGWREKGNTLSFINAMLSGMDEVKDRK